MTRDIGISLSEAVERMLKTANPQQCTRCGNSPHVLGRHLHQLDVPTYTQWHGARVVRVWSCCMCLHDLIARGITAMLDVHACGSMAARGRDDQLN